MRVSRSQPSFFLTQLFPFCRPSILVESSQQPSAATARSQMRRFLRQICFHICSPPPQPLYNRPLPPFRRPSPASMQSVSDYSRRLTRQPFPPDCSPVMLDHSPLTDYPREPFPPESPVFESEQLLFGPLDMDRHDPSLSFPWDATGLLPTSPVPTHSDTASPASSASLLEFGTSPPSSDLSFTPGSFPGLADANHAFADLDDRNLYSNWLVDDLSAPPSASVPIIVSSAPSNPQPPLQSNLPYGGDNGSLAFPKMGPFSPSLEYPTIRTLPRSVEETPMTSISPPQITQPSWAAQFWSHANATGANASPLPQLLHPPDESDNFATQRAHRGRNNSLPVHAIFQSSSAPPGFQVRTPPQARGYSRRAESVSTDDDFDDATIRRKRKVSVGPASSDRTRQAEGRSFFMTSTSSFPAYIITNSSSKVASAAPQAGPLCLAALLYGLDPATSGN